MYVYVLCTRREALQYIPAVHLQMSTTVYACSVPADEHYSIYLQCTCNGAAECQFVPAMYQQWSSTVYVVSGARLSQQVDDVCVIVRHTVVRPARVLQLTHAPHTTCHVDVITCHH